MRCTRNPPGLFNEQWRRGRSTWPAATSSWGLRAGGGRLLSIHLVRDNQTRSSPSWRREAAVPQREGRR